MSQNEWIKCFTREGWFWHHDGNPKRPHALLTSGNHSNGYFDATELTRYPSLLDEACKELERMYHNQLAASNMLDAGLADAVFGSAYGAIFIAYEIAKSHGCTVGYTLPEIVDRKKKMIVPKRFKIRPGQRVILVEDVLTTGGTTLLTAQALESQKAVVLPVVLVIVNRSGKKELDSRRIVSLIDVEMPIWVPEECPLCKEGSEAIRPKGNWDRLTGDYD